MLATSIAAEEDTPLPSGTPELTCVPLVESITAAQLIIKSTYTLQESEIFKGGKEGVEMLK